MAVTQAESESSLSEVLTRATRGDMDAFCQVVSQLESRLLGQAFALCGDLPTAEDLAQQTWIEAWKSLGRFDHSCRFTTWLYAILLHSHYHLLRHKRSRPISLATLPHEQSESSEEETEPSPEPDPQDSLLRKELSEEWRRRLTESLPEIHREVILLRYFEDATLEEIAAVTDASVNTVKTRLHYALKKLRALENKMNFPESGRHT